MEDKIEVGEYVRTNQGHIGVLKRIELDENDKSLKWYVFDKKEFETNIVKEEYINKPYIVKHSKNIIDLIENEDCLIYKIRGSDILRKGFVRKHIDLETNREYLSIEFYSLKQIEILGIVTKEQFNSVKYEVQ